MELQVIQKKIFEVRGERVMFDFDLAPLYEVETRVLNQAIKRNIESFPKDFMFRLTTTEWEGMSSQIVMTSSNKRPKTALPYVFTEHGVTMLASVLKSPKARQMNIAIVRAFIALRKTTLQQGKVLEQLQELRERVGEHDIQLNSIYDAIENLLDNRAKRRLRTRRGEERRSAEVPAENKSWQDRERIGFKRNPDEKGNEKMLN
jgi:phage regulator Rha-like protein